MPVYRTPDGKIVEEKAPISDRVGITRRPDTPAPGVGGNRRRTDDRTVKVASGEAGSKPGSEAADDDRTRLVGRPRRRAEGVEDGVERQVPVTGWLVVLAGPGMGRSLPLGPGKNDLGRGSDSRVPLNFGDLEISRTAHAIVTYDPRGRTFYISDGNARSENLTYVDDAPVLAPTELAPFAEIRLGGTRLRFVPFCGADFDWGEGGEARPEV